MVVKSEGNIEFSKYLKLKSQYKNRKKSLKRKVFNRDGIECQCCKTNYNICAYCGDKNNLTLDHIKPWRKGGENSAENLQILCMDCNRRKKSK